MHNNQLTYHWHSRSRMKSSFSTLPTGFNSVKLGLVAVAAIVAAIGITSCAQFHQPGDPDARAKVPLNPPGTSKGKLPENLAGDLPGPGKTDHTGAIRHDIDSPRIVIACEPVYQVGPDFR